MKPAGVQESRITAQEKWFATTHWSVVLAAGHDSSPGAQEALEKLCSAYRYPLYAYVRRQGHSPDDAQDLTQAFFARLLEKKSLRHAQKERGRFRTFLLTSLKHFLIHEWERTQSAKRGGGSIHLSWDQTTSEERYLLEPVSDLTPDKVFDQRWALTLFQDALSRLRHESATAGKSDRFEQLKAFLTDEPAEGAYQKVAERLGMSPDSVAVSVHRLRQRYGELVREGIAQTVASPAEVQEELRYLIALVGK
jgi:RNA polymerase sigma-70 factor (ECF subfamily)